MIEVVVLSLLAAMVGLGVSVMWLDIASREKLIAEIKSREAVRCQVVPLTSNRSEVWTSTGAYRAAASREAPTPYRDPPPLCPTCGRPATGWPHQQPRKSGWGNGWPRKLIP